MPNHPSTKPPRVGGLQLDPAVLDALNAGAARNQAALTEQQKRDQQRISLRLDCPQWLKTEAERLAAGEQVTVSQFADFLLAWAMAEYRNRNADLLAAIDENRYPTRSLRAKYGLAPDGFNPPSPVGGGEVLQNSLYEGLFVSASMDA